MNPFKQTLIENAYYRCIAYKVHGFWSGESVRIHQTKDSKNEPWNEPVINWSTGGRDHSEEKDDLIASECFARAVLNAVEIAKEWQTKP